MACLLDRIHVHIMPIDNSNKKPAAIMLSLLIIIYIASSFIVLSLFDLQFFDPHKRYKTLII
jgi:hypothetical protein